MSTTNLERLQTPLVFFGDEHETREIANTSGVFGDEHETREIANTFGV